MSRGAKAADPSMRVLPGSFPFAETLQILTPEHLRHLDGLNVHIYSWIGTNRGRTGVHPEHPSSLFRELFPFIRFRDRHLPGLPIYLTEFGWDSDGAGQNCTFSECVSERSQALYAVRGSMYLARLSMVRLSWFFYGNLPDGKDGVFSRSGLTASADVGNSAPKQSLLALASLRRHLGSARHLAVVKESHEGFVYLLGNDNGPTHVIGWLPIEGDSTATKSVTFTLPHLPLRPFPLYNPLNMTRRAPNLGVGVGRVGGMGGTVRGKVGGLLFCLRTHHTYHYKKVPNKHTLHNHIVSGTLFHCHVGAC